MRRIFAFLSAFLPAFLWGALPPAGPSVDDSAATAVGSIKVRPAEVVVSIKPLHSLVQGVMDDTGKARLLVEGDASPHGFSFKPSQIKALHDAAVVFYISDTFESFLPAALAALPPDVRGVSVVERAGLTVLPRRKGGAWKAHGNREHNHHGDRGGDLHVWLDPGNAKKIVAVIAAELGGVYPGNRETYERNARALTARLDALDAELENALASVRDRPFIVSHDAYRYFERRYGLTNVGSMTLEPHEPPSARRIREVRAKIRSAGVVCVFREPQSSDRLVNTVIGGAHDSNGGGVRIGPGIGPKIGVLDPLGAGIEAGADLYFELLGNLGGEFKRCLS